MRETWVLWNGELQLAICLICSCCSTSFLSFRLSCSSISFILSVRAPSSVLSSWTWGVNMCVREHMCVPFDVRVYVHVYAIRVQVAKHLVVLLVLLANIRELDFHLDCSTLLHVLHRVQIHHEHGISSGILGRLFFLLLSLIILHCFFYLRQVQRCLLSLIRPCVCVCVCVCVFVCAHAWMS